jgi:hypothetical protein
MKTWRSTAPRDVHAPCVSRLRRINSGHICTATYRYQWKCFLPASRSSLNPPGPREKANNLSFRTRHFIKKLETIIEMSLLIPLKGLFVACFCHNSAPSRTRRTKFKYHIGTQSSYHQPGPPIPTRSLHSNNRPRCCDMSTC